MRVRQIVVTQPNGSRREYEMPVHRSMIAALGVLACAVGFAADPPVDKSVTLLGMLSEWQYPSSTFNGTESSDPGVRDISSIKSKALLTTPDSVEKPPCGFDSRLGHFVARIVTWRSVTPSMSSAGASRHHVDGDYSRTAKRGGRRQKFPKSRRG